MNNREAMLDQLGAFIEEFGVSDVVSTLSYAIDLKAGITDDETPEHRDAVSMESVSMELQRLVIEARKMGI